MGSHLERVIADAARLRRALHANPEPSNHEKATAKRVQEFLGEAGLRPWRKNVGGNGLVYVVRGRRAGRRQVFRADLDALPIHEATKVQYRSTTAGAHHACGHDGHMAMLAGALRLLAQEDDFAGDVVAVFQPAEETGEGAKRMLDDLGRDWNVDRAFAIHNYPGIPVGAVGIRTGTAARSSVGIEILFTGTRGHASEPDQAVNPLPAMARLALELQPRATVKERFGGRTLTTLVSVGSEGPNFGVSTADARLCATLRGDTTKDVERLVARIERRAKRLAIRDGLEVEVRRHDPFPATRNHPKAAREAVAAARGAGLRAVPQKHPLSASEDFGHFTERAPGALILLGAGHVPRLHASTYDFPDGLLGPGIRLWCRLAGLDA